MSIEQFLDFLFWWLILYLVIYAFKSHGTTLRQVISKGASE